MGWARGGLHLWLLVFRFGVLVPICCFRSSDARTLVFHEFRGDSSLVWLKVAVVRKRRFLRRRRPPLF